MRNPMLFGILSIFFLLTFCKGEDITSPEKDDPTEPIDTVSQTPKDTTNQTPVDTTSQQPVVIVTQTPWAYNTPFPFDQSSKQELRASSKKVFAHYFPSFPISIDNKDPNADYYANGFLNPYGESNKYLSAGGYLRSRPIPRPVVFDNNWPLLDMEEEVRRAIAIGLDGFVYNLMDSEGLHYTRIVRLMDAARNVDPGFKVMIMPDMEAFKNRAEDIAGVVKSLADHPSAYRLADNRLVIAPYNANNKDVTWWTNWLKQMKADGIDIAFVPLFGTLYESYATSFAPISYGLTEWGRRSVGAQVRFENMAEKVHNDYKTIYMMPVAPQDMRPRSNLVWEAGNSDNYRVSWENTINGGSDWVQIVTWNDYSEHSHLSPSTGTQYSYYDLTAYYVNWFKTGVQPVIQRDVLYYFYRKHHTSLVPKKQEKMLKFDQGSDPPLNNIELLAFLQSSGTLEIEIGGEKLQMEAGAGINSFKIPLKTGLPIFRLLRNNEEVITLPGAFEIVDEADWQNLLYKGGSNSRLPVETKK